MARDLLEQHQPPRLEDPGDLGDRVLPHGNVVNDPEVDDGIDRLYRVAPQLHNQRVELKKSKLEQLESAREVREAPGEAGKQKERELERIVDMIGRASERKLVQQTVILGDMDARIERARQRDVQKVRLSQLLPYPRNLFP